MKCVKTDSSLSRSEEVRFRLNCCKNKQMFHHWRWRLFILGLIDLSYDPPIKGGIVNHIQYTITDWWAVKSAQELNARRHKTQTWRRNFCTNMTITFLFNLLYILLPGSCFLVIFQVVLFNCPAEFHSFSLEIGWVSFSVQSLYRIIFSKKYLRKLNKWARWSMPDYTRTESKCDKFGSNNHQHFRRESFQPSLI